MIISDPNTLLYIEPTSDKSETPTIDGYTRKMAAALQSRISTGVLQQDGTYDKDSSTLGFQRCSCRVTSDVVDYELSDGVITNSLCVHYLAWHRQEVPQTELDKVLSLSCGEAEPSQDVLK